jgi:hypothetical protein
MRTLLSVGLTGALLLASSRAENLLENGGFELPKITGRTPASKGGDPSLPEEKTLWTSLLNESVAKGGRLIAGMTDEIAHEGKQSLYIDFEKLTAPGQSVILSSELLPVQPNKPYRISIWGRLNRERPLALDERRPHLLVEVEYFAADQETQIGSAMYRVQMIPGSVVPGLGTRLLFVANKWSEYNTEIQSPTNSAFMKVVFNVNSSKEEGETDGVLYLDSAAVDGERGSATLTTQESVPAEENPAESAGSPPPAEIPKKAK